MSDDRFASDFKELSKSLLDIAWSFGPKGLDGACCQDLGLAEFLALEGISNIVDCPVQQVGTVLGFTKSGATRVVNRLVSKGYVVKQTAGHDARVCCLKVTDNGKRILKESYARYETILTRVFKNLGPADRKGMKESLILFSTLLMREEKQ